MKTETTNAELKKIEAALGAALIHIAPPRDLLERLQTRVKELSPGLSATADRPARPNLTYIGLAGVFTLLMTLAVGFRTAGSIVGAIALVNEMNRQLKARKAGGFTPAG